MEELIVAMPYAQTKLIVIQFYNMPHQWYLINARGLAQIAP